jgi:hypothetical protein
VSGNCTLVHFLVGFPVRSNARNPALTFPGFVFGPGFAFSFSTGAGVPAPEPLFPSPLRGKTLAPGPAAPFLFPCPRPFLRGWTALGTGDEATVGGDDGGKGEDIVFTSWML